MNFAFGWFLRISLLTLLFPSCMGECFAEQNYPVNSEGSTSTGSRTVKHKAIDSKDIEYTLSPSAWQDNGAWMNSVTKISQFSDSDGKFAAAFDCHAAAQLYCPFPPLKKGMIYHILIQYKCDGQIEKLKVGPRKLLSPYTSWGSVDLSISPTWRSYDLQMKTAPDVDDYALFLNANGTGTVSIKEITMIEKATFDFGSDQSSNESLLPNGTFLCNGAGWGLTNSTVDSHGLHMVPIDGQKAEVTSETIFELRPGRKYICALKIQPSQGNSNLSVSIVGKEFPDDQNTQVIKEFNPVFTPNGIWQDEFEIPVPAYGILEPKKQVFLTLSTKSDQTISCIEIHEGNNSFLARGIRGPVSATTAFEKEGQIVRRIWNGESADLILRTTNVPEGRKASILVRDINGKVDKVLSGVIARQTDGSMGLNVKNVLLQPGWFDCETTFSNKVIPGTQAELAVCLPPNDDKQASDFVLGTHLLFWNDDGTLSSNGKARLTAARSLGIESVRFHPPLVTKWWNVEPVKGTWVFHDETIDAPVEAGISVLGSLDGTAKYASSAPDDILAQATDNYPNGWGEYLTTSDEAWRNYVRTIVTHFKGRIKDWEIGNEPDGGMFLKLNPKISGQESAATAYFGLVKSASEEIRKIDPGIRIVAGAVTAGNPDFLPTAIDLGLLDYCDAISFHGYGRSAAADQGAAAFADIVGSLRQKMTEKGKTVELWDTEATVNSFQQDGRANIPDAQLELKAIVARRAVGISRVYLYSGLDKNFPMATDFRLLWGYNDRPLAIQPMITAYKHFLGGAKFQKDLYPQSNSEHAYIFRNGAHDIAAGWISKGKESVANDPAGGKGKYYSVVGAPIGNFQDGQLPLGREIRYFVFD